MAYFSKLVGQDTVKTALGVYIDSYKKGSVLPHILAVAPKGVGKTVFCRKFQDYLGKEIFEFNGSQFKTPKGVAESVFSRFMGKQASILIDEVHGMSKAVQDLFLTILNPEPTHKTKVTIDGFDYEFDFKNNLTFIFATTERHLLFSPLLDRMEEISFDEYTNHEITQILSMHSKNITFKDDGLEELTKYSRGNARWAMKTGQKLQSYCCARDITEVGASDILEFNKTMGIYELGLMKQEVNLLKILSQYPNGATLKIMCAKTGNTAQAQQDMEKYPQKHNLMDIDGKRKITQKGLEYLRNINNA